MSFYRNDQVVMRVPADAIRADEAGVPPPPTKEDIVNIRLSSHKFINELWLRLAGRTYKEIDGEGYLVRLPYGKPLMNDEGAMHIIHAVSSVVNPTVTLAKISDQEYIQLSDSLEKAIAELIVDKGKEYDITRNSTKKLVTASLSPLIRGQLSRAVNGFEAKNLITQITEQRAESDIKESISSSGGLRLRGQT